jgi:hypothetical protein
VIHDVRFVHHIPLAKGSQLLELIGEKLSADVESSQLMNDSTLKSQRASNSPFDGVPNHFAIHDGNRMSETKTGINDQHAFRRR